MKRVVRGLLRVAIVALLLATLFDVPLPSGPPPRTLILAVDASGSVPASQRADALRAAEWARARLGAGERLLTLAFSDRAVPFSEGFPDLERDRSDLGRAIEAAVALADGRGHVILATDGRDTEGRLDRALLLASSRGVPVHALPLGHTGVPDVRIARVDAPATLPPGARAQVAVTLASTGPIRGTLNGLPFAFSSAAMQDLVLRDVDPSVPLSLRVAAEDSCPENNAAEVTLLTRDERPLVRTPPALAPAFADCTVRTSGRPEEFDVVILDALDPAAAVAAREAGVGLIALGGPRAYAFGGYARTPLEEVLPLWAFPDERATLVFALDRSGSMAAEAAGTGLRRVDVASKALRAALELLRPEDSWAVVAFAGHAETVVPLRTGPGSLPVLQAGGPTQLGPALREAFRVCSSSTTGRRHILLITDGESREQDAELDALGRRIAEDGVGLTVVATGPEVAPRLRLLGGRVVAAPDVERLEPVLREALGRSRELIAESAPLTVGDHPLLHGLRLPASLSRIHRTSAKPGAETILASDGHPVLALGTAGGARVAAAAFSLDEGWTADSAQRAALATLVRRLIDHLRPPAPGVASATAALEGNEIVFRVRARADRDVLDGHPAPLLRMGPDLYEARVAARPGTTVLRLAGRPVASYTLPHAREYAAVGPDREVLGRIAKDTGGRVIAGLEEIVRLPRLGPPAARSGRPLFLVAALALFMFEILLTTFRR